MIKYYLFLLTLMRRLHCKICHVMMFYILRTYSKSHVHKIHCCLFQSVINPKRNYENLSDENYHGEINNGNDKHPITKKEKGSYPKYHVSCFGDKTDKLLEHFSSENIDAICKTYVRMKQNKHG